MKKWLYSVVTTVALFLLAALGFARPNSPAKVHADTINDVVTSVNISKSTGGAITDPLGVWESFQVEANFVLPNGRVKREIRPLSNLEMTLRSLKRTPLTCWIQVVKRLRQQR